MTTRFEYEQAQLELSTTGPVTEQTAETFYRLLTIVNNYRMENPRTWWKTPPKPKLHNEYFVTFTHSDKKSTKEEFKKTVIHKITTRTTWKDYVYCFEHEDTNIHCHALLNCGSNRINETNFKTIVRDHGKVHWQTVSTDNGIEQYISKENKPTYKPDGDYVKIKSCPNTNAVQTSSSSEEEDLSSSPPSSP